jgi:hypothetical protein
MFAWMRSIARIGDRKVPILISRDEEKKRSPSPDHYTGMKVFADPGKAIYGRAAAPATGQLRNDKPADLKCFDCRARSGATRSARQAHPYTTTGAR